MNELVYLKWLQATADKAIMAKLSNAVHSEMDTKVCALNRIH